MPLFLRNVLPEIVLLGAFSLHQAGLTFWLLSGWKTKKLSSVCYADVTGNNRVNITVLEIVFRDIGLLLAAVALGVLHHKNEHDIHCFLHDLSHRRHS